MAMQKNKITILFLIKTSLNTQFKNRRELTQLKLIWSRLKTTLQLNFKHFSVDKLKDEQ